MGKTRVLRRVATTVDCVLVMTRRPAGPSGHRPSSSSASGRLSNTTSHGRVVSPSQLTKRAATDSAVPFGSMPVAASDASA